jgi:hypothetical protein
VAARELGIAQAGALKAINRAGTLHSRSGFLYPARDGFDTHLARRRAVVVLESLVRLGLAEVAVKGQYPAYRLTDAGRQKLEEL